MRSAGIRVATIATLTLVRRLPLVMATLEAAMDGML